MNNDRFEGLWNQIKGTIKEKWGQLTDDDLTAVEGKRDRLVGKVQSRYGHAKDKVEGELDELMAKYGDAKDDAKSQIGELKDDAKEKIAELSDAAHEKGRDLRQGLRDKL